MISKEEKLVFKRGYQLVAGIDEAGRGSWAGPVAAAVVVLKDFSKRNFLKMIPLLKGHSLSSGKVLFKDSKSLSSRQREEVFEMIRQEPALDWRVSFVWPQVIDRINIGQATLLAWRRSFKKLNYQPDFLFLDGNQIITRLAVDQQSIIKGDQKILLLSLASIIAKVSRDRLMEQLDQKYPGYDFYRHKGYGTKIHFGKLKKMGPLPIHRKSFRPVFENLPFKDKVYYVVSQIPRGQVMTYQEVAQKIGHPKAFRAVGNVLNKNVSPQVPCHRVIRSDGQIGGFREGSWLKRKILKEEGLII